MEKKQQFSIFYFFAALLLIAMLQQYFGPQHANSRAVKAIIDEAFGNARQVLSQNRPALDRGAALLLQKETLNGNDLRDLAGANVETPPVPERIESAVRKQSA